jgi:hypothetical protein
VVARVLQAVQAAAAEPIETGRAEVAVRRLTEMYEDASYDCPAVVLTPVRPGRARVLVEVQGDALWWLHAGDGPGTELHAELEGDRYEVLASLVRAVVAGRYRHGPCTKQVRRVLRSPALRRGWFETFETDDGPFTSRHFGCEVPPGVSRFAPY